MNNPSISERVFNALHSVRKLSPYERQCHVVTSTNASVIIGKNKHCSNDELFKRKTCTLINTDQRQNDFQLRGIKAESLILKNYLDHQKLSIKDVYTFTTNEFFVMRDHSYLATSIDGLLKDGTIIEIKATSFDPYEPFEEHVIQALFNCMVLNLDMCRIIYGDFDGQIKKIYDIPRRPSWEEKYMEDFKQFARDVYSFHQIIPTKKLAWRPGKYIWHGLETSRCF